MTGDSRRVVTALVAAGLVDPARSAEAESVVSGTVSGTPTASSTRSGLAEIAGYVGGALVLAAVGLFLAQEWSALSDTAQVLTLTLIALLLLGAGVLVSRVGSGYAELRAGSDDVRRRLTSALLTGGSLAAALAAGVQATVQGGDSSWPGLVGGLTMLVLAGGGYVYAPSALGQLAAAGAAITTIVSGLGVVDAEGGSALWPGLLVLGLGLGWVALTESGRFHEPVLARAVGTAMAVVGAQLPLLDGDLHNVAYGLTTLVALLGFAGYLRTPSWPYLVGGVAGITLVVPEAVIDWTEGSLGLAGGVLVAGLALLGASLAGFRLRRAAAEPE